MTITMLQLSFNMRTEGNYPTNEQHHDFPSQVSEKTVANFSLFAIFTYS